ncbi:retinol dehydrogenase 13-like [Drosophila nasuta]|uniref:retinol dehydrogenase 13-like n=1 Tax=Drosophila nasuta TaxID=42062 RepID=UPI00295F3589|nr:retinol dehydrogenase 13-like [Drosophila nasuta]
MCTFINFLLSPCVLWPVLGAAAIYFLRQYMQGGQFEKQTNETGKVVIVIGSNTGIGKETVLELARRGATVYMACRDKMGTDQVRLEIIRETNNQNILFRELDLASMDSIRKFVTGFKGEQDKLHILINTLTEDGFKMQRFFNHIAHFVLTGLLLDVLKKSAPSRIVNVTSFAHNHGTSHINDDDWMSENLKEAGVTVNYIHPDEFPQKLFLMLGYNMFSVGNTEDT